MGRKVYYVEMGKTVRVYLDKPSTPRGPVIEVSKQQLQALEKSPRETWKMGAAGTLVAGSARVVPRQSPAALIASSLLGAVMGAAIVYFLMR